MEPEKFLSKLIQYYSMWKPYLISSKEKPRKKQHFKKEIETVFQLVTLLLIFQTGCSYKYLILPHVDHTVALFNNIF